MSDVKFTNINIFDGSGSAPYPGEVLVSGSRIKYVSRGIDANRFGAPVTVDGAGCTLMPGLIESHAHLTWPSSVERVVNTMRLPIEEHLLKIKHRTSATRRGGSN